MKIHGILPNTLDWRRHRDYRISGYFNASDAASMMGVEGAHSTRDQLLRVYKYGIETEVTEYLQRKYNDGHRFEALARPLAEIAIGEDLYPVIGTRDNLSASFDGLTADYEKGWEHKTLNKLIKDAFLAVCGQSGLVTIGVRLPLIHQIQMQQQMYVSGAKSTLFTASKWTSDDELVEAFHTVCDADIELQNQIVKGWQQFKRDLDAMPEVCESTTMPALIGRVVEDDSPELEFELGGVVVFVKNNLEVVKARWRRILDEKNTVPTTDQDFKDAEKKIEWAKVSEDKLTQAEEHVFSKNTGVRAAVALIRQLREDLRKYRLDQSRYVEDHKATLKVNIINAGEDAFRAHVKSAFGSLQWPIQNRFFAPHIDADFRARVKSLKSFDSMRSKINDYVAELKIKADDLAALVFANVATANELLRHDLWPDLSALVTKPADDFRAILQSRIAEAEKAEEARRARASEQEKPKLVVGAIGHGHAGLAAALTKAQSAKPETQTVLGASLGDQSGFGMVGIGPAPDFDDDTFPVDRALNEDSEPLEKLTLGAINQRLGFTVNRAFLESLGLECKPEGKAAVFETRFSRIVFAIQTHLEGLL